MKITIRAVEDLEADWPKIWELADALDHHHSALLGRPLREGREERARKSMSKEFVRNRDRSRILLAEDEGRAVGMVEAHIAKNAGPYEETVGIIGHSYMRPEYRGTPTMLRLQHQIEDWLRSRGAKEAQHNTYIANERAIGLWHRLGYTPSLEMMRKRL